jgi:hypothetical protein
MNQLQRAAILSMLTEALRSKGSWAGETHVQKAAFMLQHAAGVPLDYDFILYKHGPFSFDLRDELNDFNAEGLLVSDPQPYPYGPKLHVTDLGAKNIERHPKTTGQYGDAVARVADFLGARNVSSLERIATALLLIEESSSASDEEIADRLVSLKPHVSRFASLSAVKELRSALSTLR